ncbi:MAG: cell division protein FtsZ [Parcubacteria group bacterium Athens1014_26]|nr:MAG: cell division protein FtsZ [Parcubacteria group bacterium Athens1014_26]
MRKIKRIAGRLIKIKTRLKRKKIKMAKNKFSSKNNEGLVSHSLAKIKVVGVGGGGGNAVHRMKNDFIKGVEFIAINTDAQDLAHCDVPYKIHIGKNLTRGLGTGMNPELGRQAAEETKAEIIEALKGADLVFITAGLGGGTGTGAAPIIAEAAKELGALTIAVVTKPFSFEGAQRNRVAQDGLAKLKDKVDTLIVVPNDRIFAVVSKDTSIIKAFEVVDDVLRCAVEGIADLVAMPGIVNVDFADVRAIMQDAGTAIVGLGVASSQDRGVKAISQAIHSPLLEYSIDGAKGVLFGIFGGKDLKMSEINDIARIISETIDPGAKVIFGAYYDKKMRPGFIKVTVIATGFSGLNSGKMMSQPPSTLFGVSEPDKKINFQESLNTKSVNELKNENNYAGSRLADKQVKKKNPDEVWDIPAFLRRGKNKK